MAFYEGCMYGKQHKEPFSTKGALRANVAWHFIYFDVCGPMKIPCSKGAKYLITFIDDYSEKTL